MALVGFMILSKVLKPSNRIHVALIAVMIIGMGYCIVFMPEMFGISSISMQAAMLLVVFLIATEAVFRYIYKFLELVGNIGKRGKKKKRKH